MYHRWSTIRMECLFLSGPVSDAHLDVDSHCCCELYALSILSLSFPYCSTDGVDDIASLMLSGWCHLNDLLGNVSCFPLSRNIAIMAS
jgi:hypothetical protein